MLEYEGDSATAVVMIDEIDPATEEQIKSCVNDRSFSSPIVIMPDCHKGEGSVIGFTMYLSGNSVIIPNIVGVDQSCGMLAFKLDKEFLNRDFSDIDKAIREHVPLGMEVNKKPIIDMKNFGWVNLNNKAEKFTKAYNRRFNKTYEAPEYNLSWFSTLCRRIGIDQSYAECSIGSLGSGNHFIEFGVDEGGSPWVTVHSGSRNLGLRAANYWQREAEKRAEKSDFEFFQKQIKSIKETNPKKNWETLIEDARKRFSIKNGFEFLEAEDSFGYLMDALFCGQYAAENRHGIIDLIDNAVDLFVEYSIHTVHNYIDPRDFIIRKGAVASYEGEQFILPFNMEDGILICEGKSNKEWNFSAPHGAGRILSRTEANKVLNEDISRKSMEAKNIYVTELPRDELKGAYKSCEVIEKAIEPTAKIIHRIKPFLPIKAPSKQRRSKRRK